MKTLYFILFGLLAYTSALNSQTDCDSEQSSETGLCFKYNELSNPLTYDRTLTGTYYVSNLPGSGYTTSFNSENINIDGTLIIDIPHFSIINCKIKMEPNSRIEVGSGKWLTVRSDTEIWSCAELWAGIDVKKDGYISVRDCHIENAAQAIKMTSPSNYWISDNLFNNNLFSIWQEKGLKRIPRPFVSLYTIVGNTFTSDAPILDVPEEA